MNEFLSVVIVFGSFFFFFIYLPIKSQRKKASDQIVKYTADAAELRKKVLVVSSDTIPGKEIKEVFGHVTGTSGIEASTPEQADAAEKQAMVCLMQNALDMGANAVIDAKLSISSHEQQGSKWMVSKSYYTGTAVMI